MPIFLFQKRFYRTTNFFLLQKIFLIPAAVFHGIIVVSLTCTVGMLLSGFAVSCWCWFLVFWYKQTLQLLNCLKE